MKAPGPGTIALSRTTVVSLATAAVHRAKTVAVVAAVIAAVCLAAGLADIIGSGSRSRNDSAAATLVVSFAAVAVVAMLRARRVARTAERAAWDTASSWTLVGKLVVVADEHGMPAPELSFKITGAQRATLVYSQSTTTTTAPAT